MGNIILWGGEIVQLCNLCATIVGKYLMLIIKMLAMEVSVAEQLQFWMYIATCAYNPH
jgi:hypothetical protein